VKHWQVLSIAWIFWPVRCGGLFIRGRASLRTGDFTGFFGSLTGSLVNVELLTGFFVDVESLTGAFPSTARHEGKTQITVVRPPSSDTSAENDLLSH